MNYSYVRPIGPLDAKIAIVGEAPGATEEAQGIPFVGGSGQLAQAMVLSKGINWKDCYVTNVMNYRPPGNDFGYFYEAKNRHQPKMELTLGIERLHKELLKVKPNVILAFGDEPMRALTNNRGITNWRGSIVDTKFGKVIATFHPAFVMRMYSNRAVTEMDIERVRKESHKRECVLPKHELLINPSYPETIQYLRNIYDNKLKVAFDIETTGERVRCLGFAISSLKAICIPFIGDRYALKKNIISLGGGKFNSHWGFREEKEILSWINKIFLDEKITKIAQNFPFDSSVLAYEFGFRIHGDIIDTMVAHHCCYSELPKRLDFLCSMYTRVPRYSDYNVQDDSDTWRYNAMDCCVDYECAERIKEDCKQGKVWEFYRNHAQPTMLALTRAQNRGFMVDLPVFQEREFALEQERVEKQLEIEKLLNREFNVASTPQVQKYLYEELKLPVQKNRGKRTADEKAIAKLRSRYPQFREVFDLIIKIRKLRKLLSTVFNSKLTEDGIMLTSYGATGTVTGRINSSINVFGYGTNIQNIHKDETRRIFRARPDWTYIKTDLSQAEARAVAWLANIKPMIDRFLNDPNFDIHTWVAANYVYNIPESEVTEKKRTHTKAAVHGGNYRVGASELAARFGLTYTTAEKVLRGYPGSVPEIQSWWARVEEEIIGTRTLVTPMGRRRIFLGRKDKKTFKEGYAQVPQGLVADIINRAFFITDIIFDEKECYPLIQCHDEIVFECRTDKIEKYIPKIKTILEYPIKVEGVKELLRIPVDISTGANWYDQEEYKYG